MMSVGQAVAPVLDVMLDSLVKGSVVLLLAALVARALRGHSAAARCAVWVAALVAQLALPFLAIALPAWQLPILPAAPQVTAALAPAVAAPPSPSSFVSLAFLIAWLAGGAVILTRLGLGVITIRRLRQQAVRVDKADWLGLLRRVASSLRIGRRIELLKGNRLMVPVTWGVVHPTVLLPEQAAEWPAVRRRFVLMHEMAHVKRFDAVTQFLGQLALAVFWMNPLVWLAVRRMGLERECACDDYVLRDGMPASSYAHELLEIVRTLRAPANPAFIALGPGQQSEFEIRMLAILDPSRGRRTMGWRTWLAGTVAAALVIVPLAVLEPTAKPALRRAAVPVAVRKPAAIPATQSRQAAQTVSQPTPVNPPPASPAPRRPAKVHPQPVVPPRVMPTADGGIPLVALHSSSFDSTVVIFDKIQPDHPYRPHGDVAFTRITVIEGPNQVHVTLTGTGFAIQHGSKTVAFSYDSLVNVAKQIFNGLEHPELVERLERQERLYQLDRLKQLERLERARTNS